MGDGSVAPEQSPEQSPDESHGDSPEERTEVLDGIVGGESAERTETSDPAQDAARAGSADPATPTESITPHSDNQVVAPAVIGAESQDEPPAPRPSGKSRPAASTLPRDLNRADRDTGVSAIPASDADTATATGTGTETGGTGETGSKPAKKRSPVLIAALLTVLALGLAALAIWFRAETSALNENQAWVDPARTEEVKSQATKAVEGLFSYNYTDTGKTEKLAKDLLAGDNVRKRYDQLFAQVKKEAPKQQLVLTSKVARSAVTRLEDERARVLVFLDQTSTRAKSGETVANGAQLSLNMELQGDRWKVSGIDLFNKKPPTGKQQQPSQPKQQPAPGN